MSDHSQKAYDIKIGVFLLLQKVKNGIIKLLTGVLIEMYGPLKKVILYKN